MARFLIGWELGASPDLLLDAADIAYALIDRGHEVRIAVGDPVTLATVLDVRLADSILPAPVPPLRPDLVMKPPKEGGITDKFVVQGFGSPAVLSALAITWRNLIAAVSPAVVISLGAPVLSFAARGHTRLLVAGSCETMPPFDTELLPRLHANVAPTMEDTQILLNANLVARTIGAAVVASPAELLRGDDNVVYGLAQFDPYGALRRTPPCGPMAALPSPAVPATRPAATVILDVYFPGIETLLLALTDFGRTPVHVYIRGMTRHMHAYLAQSPAIVVHASLAEALATAADATYVLHHATARTAALCLGLGVPQILLPFTVEQNAVADMLQRMNAGFRLQMGTDPTAIADTLLHLFRNLDMVQNAQHAARQLALDPPAAAIPKIAQALENLATG